MAKRNDNMLGIILILIGVAVFLLNTDFLPEGALLIILGVGFLVGYYYKKHTGYLIAGLVILIVGISSFIDDLNLTTVDLSGFLFMLGLGIVFLFLYVTKGIPGFVYPGCILPSIGIFSLVDDMYGGELVWVFFALLALSFYVIYLFEHRKNGSTWPLIPGTVLLVLSGLFFLTSEDIITSDFWRIISYIWPTVLILIGVRIIYNNYKLKR